MEDNYPKAYKEVIEILEYVPKESVEKIPQDMIDTFKANMDNNYDFKVDVNKTFEEQEILDETKAIFANIFRDYWATPYQKEKIIAKENYDIQKAEEEKRSIYNPDDMFKKHKMRLEDNSNIQQVNDNLPIEIKKERFYIRIIEFFRKMFHL